MNEQLENYQNELSYLEAWFKEYDSKVIQYQRHIRLNGVSDIDIVVLDAQAIVNSARIKELRILIAHEFEVMFQESEKINEDY